IDGAEIAARMVHSVCYELAPLLQHYEMFRFAFPHLGCPALDGLEADLRTAIAEAFAETPAYVLEHPYPVDLAELADAISAIVAPAHDGGSPGS
ncbi:MAG: hypothetical protein ACE5GB_11215, partial [Acidimicrobiales bacterium]